LTSISVVGLRIIWENQNAQQLWLNAPGLKRLKVVRRNPFANIMLCG